MAEPASQPSTPSLADGLRSTRAQRSVGAGDAPSGIPRAVWRSLELAAERGCAACNAVEGAERRREPALAAALVEGVRRALGDRSLCAAAKSYLPAGKAVRLTRRAFLADATHAESLDPAAVVRIVHAIERVESALDDQEELSTLPLSGMEAFDLAVSTAHDMRAPLGAILFLADLLRRGASMSPEATRRQAGLIYNAALNLSLLANDVIDFARGSAQLTAGPPVPFSVAEIVQSAYDMVLPMAEEKQLELRMSVEGPTGRVGHPTALSRVLLNLTTNAVKFTERGRVEIAVRESAPDRVGFSVLDTGPGISSVQWEELFEAVRWRSDSGEFQISGSGLGLVICRRLLADLGSDLQVESAEARGTRFYFELDLPLAPR